MRTNYHPVLRHVVEGRYSLPIVFVYSSGKYALVGEILHCGLSTKDKVANRYTPTAGRERAATGRLTTQGCCEDVFSRFLLAYRREPSAGENIRHTLSPVLQQAVAGFIRSFRVSRGSWFCFAGLSGRAADHNAPRTLPPEQSSPPRTSPVFFPFLLVVSSEAAENMSRGTRVIDGMVHTSGEDIGIYVLDATIRHVSKQTRVCTVVSLGFHQPYVEKV